MKLAVDVGLSDLERFRAWRRERRYRVERIAGTRKNRKVRTGGVVSNCG
jgi:hypothetical protein